MWPQTLQNSYFNYVFKLKVLDTQGEIEISEKDTTSVVVLGFKIPGAIPNSATFPLGL